MALGCSPGLGFIHVGHEFSFAYDIADLYKSETTIPLAFELAEQEVEDIPNVTRRRLRDMFSKNHLLKKMVKDIKYLFDYGDDNETQIALWDNKSDIAEFGISYGKGGDNL